MSFVTTYRNALVIRKLLISRFKTLLYIIYISICSNWHFIQATIAKHPTCALKVVEDLSTATRRCAMVTAPVGTYL